MCTVSALFDYGRQRIPANEWTPDSFSMFKDIIRRLEQLDQKLNQPDCHDPTKAEWMKAIEERLRKLETLV